jgi:hypothetical protein
MITISTTDEGEARDLAEILAAGFGWPYRIYVLAREFNPVPAEADPPHPARKRLRQLLADAGRRGQTGGWLHGQLADAGYPVARQTLHDWLARDEQAGLVVRSGNGWVRKQPVTPPDVPVDRKTGRRVR